MDVPDFMKSRMPVSKKKFPVSYRIVSILFLVFLFLSLGYFVSAYMLPEKISLEDKIVNSYSMSKRDSPIYAPRSDCRVVEVVTGDNIHYFIFDKKGNMIFPYSIASKDFKK